MKLPLLLLGLGLLVQGYTYRHLPDNQSTYTSVSLADSLQKDPDSGLVIDDAMPIVKGNCTACHSSKIILQSHFSKEKWLERIRWMQRTQKLWDLGENEPVILDYLAKYYGPINAPFDGRRMPLEPIRWYPLKTR